MAAFVSKNAIADKLTFSSTFNREVTEDCAATTYGRKGLCDVLKAEAEGSLNKQCWQCNIAALISVCVCVCSCACVWFSLFSFSLCCRPLPPLFCITLCSVLISNSPGSFFLCCISPILQSFECITVPGIKAKTHLTRRIISPVQPLKSQWIVFPVRKK